MLNHIKVQKKTRKSSTIGPSGAGHSSSPVGHLFGGRVHGHDPFQVDLLPKSGGLPRTSADKEPGLEPVGCCGWSIPTNGRLLFLLMVYQGKKKGRDQTRLGGCRDKQNWTGIGMIPY